MRSQTMHYVCPNSRRGPERQAIKLQSYGNLFDHLVGTSKKRCRNVQPERVCGLEVDDKLELSRLLDRKIASTFACKDSGDISRGGAIKLEVVGRVAH